MTAKFVVYQDKAKKFRFRLLASNGQIIAVGEDYESKAACLNGIKSIKKNAPLAVVADETTAEKPAKKSIPKKAAPKKAIKKPPAAKKPSAPK
ncbi:MAG: YegP family protein [Treponema sp.]|nr:YegP family protein [Treponema sp.]MCL2270509.1 YegP family protein [Treponema sp.]